MNKREAIRACNELWKEIEKSGLSKKNFIRSPAGEKWEAKKYQYDCPLCEYVKDKECEDKCPLILQYGKECYELGFDLKPPDPEFFEGYGRMRAYAKL